ncbi:MAG: T9SS type A sorting domain-containing protein [Rhodothermaceae bacterium]|nr:T9SS type A sorting domain-containing protein [Rhodothermaceae bacterium]MXX58549.1 T9SS type A sorting domain-containing protein [Rhodothermaceae bacterium]MYD19272.1 T9SS type A sorting domain-containing protein [Rhodothermaceae bacterium]MYD56911.1 T9SS type A sorting domain-containing protein [Rhodothermaceae bacterium]MYI44552.1 T9SS type A sorting domain-containing protein [Rhodothermaceae bacterium]
MIRNSIILMRLSMPSCLLLILLSVPGTVQAQQRTVGLMSNMPGAFEGYTLIAPMLHPSVYLVDMEGRAVHRWLVNSGFGATNRLLPDGALLRASASPKSWTNVQGRAGRVEIIEWDGTIRWQYDFVNDEYMLHHDVVPLPNGNILAIVWDVRDMDEILAAGYNPDNLADDQNIILSERIVEFKPIPADSAEIVWQWDSWDHLAQDHAPLLDTYVENISDYPERIDVNTSIGGDWLHFNALDFNEELDIIAISASFLDEIWVIDHSTSTEEARGQTGGTFGLGGRLLYRWGNPRNYGLGTESDQTLHFLHSVLWIPDGLPGAGNLMVFENGVGQPEGDYSTVHELKLPYMEDLYSNAVWFAQGIDGTYEDPESVWSFSAPNEFFSDFVSGQQRLPNGNTLVAEGMTGRIFELEEGSNALVWEYVNPVVQTGPLSQGDVIPVFGPPGSRRLQNAVYRALRYGADFEGFDGRDLTPIGAIELNVAGSSPALPFTLLPNYPNPFSGSTTIDIQLDHPTNIEITVFNILGQEVAVLANEFHAPGAYSYVFDASPLPHGQYICRLIAGGSSATVTLTYQ